MRTRLIICWYVSMCCMCIHARVCVLCVCYYAAQVDAMKWRKSFGANGEINAKCYLSQCCMSIAFRSQSNLRQSGDTRYGIGLPTWCGPRWKCHRYTMSILLLMHMVIGLLP